MKDGGVFYVSTDSYMEVNVVDIFNNYAWDSSVLYA